MQQEYSFDLDTLDPDLRSAQENTDVGDLGLSPHQAQLIRLIVAVIHHRADKAGVTFEEYYRQLLDGRRRKIQPWEIESFGSL